MNPLASNFLIYYPHYKDGTESESSPQLLYLTFYDQHNTEILRINSIKQHSEPFFNTIIYTFSFSPGQYISTKLTLVISLNKKVLYKDQILFLPNKTSYIFFPGDISKLYSLFSILSSWIFEDYTVNDKDFFPKLNTLMMYIPYNNPIEDVIKNYEKINSVLNTLLTNYVTNDKMCSGYDYYVLSSLIIFGILFQESRLNAIGQNEINLLMSSVNLTENYSKFVFSIKPDILKRIGHYKLNYLYQYLGRSLLSLMAIEIFLGRIKSLGMFLTDKGKFFSYKLLNDFASINFLVQEINRRKIKLISSDEYKEFQQIIINFIKHNKKVIQDKLYIYLQALIIAGNCKEDLFSFLKCLKGIYFPSFSFYDMVEKGFQSKQWKNVNNEIFTSYILSNLDILQFCPDFFFEIDNNFAFFITTIKLIPNKYLNYNLIGKAAANKEIKSIKDIELFVMLSSSLNPNFFSMLKNIFAQKITKCLLNITFPISDELRSTMIIIFSSEGVTFFNYKEVLNAYLLNQNLTFSDLGIIFNCIFYNNITYLSFNEIKGSIVATLQLILMIYPRNQEMFLETFGSIYPKIITVNQTSNYLTEKNLKDFWSKMFTMIPHHIYIGKLCEEVSPKEQIEMSFNSQIIDYLGHIEIQNIEHANGILIQMLGDNRIKCNSKNLEYVLSYFIKNKVNTISIEENFKSVVIDNPSESDFWYMYITAEGKFISFINEGYLEEIRVKIRQLYTDITNADITYEIAKKIYEYDDERHLSIFLKYLAFSTRIDEKVITETINNIKAYFKDKDDKLVVILNIADKFSNFFNEKTKIYFSEISNYYFKSNLQKKKIKNVCVSNEISNLHQNFEEVGLWKDSVLFISVINKELSKDKAIKEGYYDLETFSSFMQNVIRKCHKCLDMLVNNSQMKFKFKSKLLDHYITLNDVQKEIDIVTAAFLYEKQDDKKILSKIFKSETNKEQFHNSISQFLNSIYSYNAYYPLCEQMLQLNSNVKLKESKLNLYQQFMIYKKAEKKSQIEYIDFSKYITGVKEILNNGESSLLSMIDFLKVFNDNFKLISFLYEVSEDEILPMNDLIDDQSDNVINVKILMNLNDLKSFLVKNIHIENTTERDFIANIEILLPSMEETKHMISLCGELFPLIEELHNELINKEEASKLKIKEIVKKSDVIINKDTISIQCGRKRKIFYKDIVELKDRCLLFISNTEDNSIDPLKQSMINSNINYASMLSNPNINNNRNSVIAINTCRTFQPQKSLTANEIFIKISSIIINIDKSLKELIKNGYPTDLTETIKIRNSDYSELSDYDKKLSTINKEWNTDIIKAYENYYALTLYYGNQLWEIVDYVSGGLIHNKLKKGEYLLQRLGRQSERRQQVQLSMLASAEKKKVDISSNKITPKERLNLLGEALMDFINGDNSSIYRRESKILKKIPIDLKKNVITFNSNITKEEKKNDIDINMSVMDNMITHKSIVDINLNMSTNENGQIQNLLFTSVDESKSNLYQYLCSIYLTYERRLPLGSQLLICDSSISPHHLISFLLRCFLLNDPNILFTIARVEQLSFNLQRELLRFINGNKYKTNWSLCVISGEEYSYLSSQIRNKENVYIIKNVEILEENTLINILKENDMINATIVTSIFTGDGKTYYIENSESDLDMNTLAIQDEIDIDDIVDNLFKLNEYKKRKIHINIRGLIKRYDILDYILFNYIFCNEFMKTNDSRICINNKESNVIYLEIANDIDITQSKVLSLLPYKKDISFSLLNFSYPKKTEANYVNNSYLNLQYFLNYIHYYNTEEIDEKDIKKDNENWIENFSIDDCRKMLNDFVIKYQNNKRLSYRQLWMYINFVGSQLIDFSNNYNFSVDVLKAKDMLTMRSFIFESLIISCEEFSMNKDIISWNTMVNKYVLLLNASSPLNAVYKDIDILPSLLINYLDDYRKEEMSNDFNAKDHSELKKILCDYTEKKENSDKKIKGQNVITDFFSNGDDNNDNINGSKYILTSDNFLKMILIIQRVRARVPIILIGETGCGKTSLIRYLTEKILKEEFNIIDLHAGTTKTEIISRINEIIDRHKPTNSNSDIEGNRIWIFLDEINTCNHLGFLSEIITEHKMNGIPLPNNIYFIGASNPYKLRKPQTGNVNKVGLQIVNSVNSISSSTIELVYKVNKFPMSINDFIWDYGTLSNDQSFMYICSILSDLPLVNLEFSQLKLTVFQSHKFIEDNETDYMVSLRDIARFKYIYNWFFHYNNNNKKDTMRSMKSLILTLFICYYIKISSMKMREIYLQLISGLLMLEYDEIRKYLKEYMNEFINTLDINSMYARNTALIENLFCLYVCIMNKFPLFICGKPGNSKTLSVNILISNFKGRESKNVKLRKFPKLIPIYYQGSQASTSEGISKVVHNAKHILANDTNNESLPIIVFDEIGLAENAPSNPLKVLHSLFDYEINGKMCFVGISNWAMDASKMNRVIYLARPDPDITDLILTGKTIYSSITSSSLSKNILSDNNDIIRFLSLAYSEFLSSLRGTPNENFYGIRDYYALIKQTLINKNKDDNNPFSILSDMIKKAFCRNFGGVKDMSKNIMKIYNEVVRKNIFNADNETLIIKNDTYNIVDMIMDNIKDISSMNRYLLLFSSKSTQGNIIHLLNHFLAKTKSSYKIMISSKFTDDISSDDYIFHKLSEIILSMEKGTCIILKDFDYLYGALYDLFNQNFTVIGNRKNCRIALGGTNNPMCYVNDAFKVIVLSNTTELPPPFLNRFEKQLVEYELIINSFHEQIIAEITQWMTNVLKLDNDVSKLCFVGYNDNTFITNIVISESETRNKDIIRLIKYIIINLANMNFSLGIDIDEAAANKLDEIKSVISTYYDKQAHSSLNDFHFKFHKQVRKAIIYTYSNILDEIVINKSNVYTFSLSEIKSENDLISRLAISNNKILIIKVDYDKDYKHLDFVYLIVNDIASQYENVYIVIYMLSSSIITNIRPITITTMKGWIHCTIDNINGNVIDYQIARSLLSLSSIEIIDKYFDVNVFNEFLTKIILSLNYSITNDDDKYMINDHMIRIINNFKSGSNVNYFALLRKAIFQLMKRNATQLIDWKEFVIEQRKKYPIHNLYKVIKDYISFAVMPHFKKIIYLIESNNSFLTFNTTSLLFTSILTNETNNVIKMRNLIPTNEIVHTESILFPFSVNNIRDIINAVSEDVTKLETVETALLMSSSNYTDDAKEIISTSMQKINDVLSFSCYLNKYKNVIQGNDAIIMNYSRDIITFYIVIRNRYKISRFPLMYRFIKNITDTMNITRNIAMLIVFLIKNEKKFKKIFSIIDMIDKENIVLKSIYENISKDVCDVRNLNDIDRVMIEAKMFNDIFKFIVDYIISHLDVIDNKTYIEVIDVLNDDSGDESHKELQLIYLFKQSQFEITQSDTNIIEQICFIIKQKLNEKIEASLINSMLNMMMIIVSLSSISQEKKNEIIASSTNNITMLPHMSLLFYKFMQSSKIINENSSMSTFEQFECSPILIDLFNKVNNTNEIKMFFIDHFGLYLHLPQEDIDNYINEHCDYVTKVISQSSSNEISFFNDILNVSYIKHFFLLFTKQIVSSLSSLDTSTKPNSKISTMLNSNSNSGLISNIKFYIIRSLISLLNIHPSLLINIDIENKSDIKWINKGLLESDGNALMILPHLPSVDEEYSKCEKIMSKLIKESDNEANINEIVEYINLSKSNWKSKFCIYQYMISSIYLSFTGNNYIKSVTYENCVNCFINNANIKTALISSLTEDGYNYITDLIRNFPSCKELSLSPSSIDIGIYIIINIMYSLMLSHKQNSFFALYSDIANEFSSKYIPGNDNDPKDESRQNMIAFVKDNYAVLGIKHGIYECQCGYLYSIGNCTRPYATSDCPFCGEKIGAKSKHVVVDTSKCLINCENKKTVNKDEMIENMIKGLKKTRGYFVQDNIIPIRKMHDSMYVISLIVHSIFLFKKEKEEFNDKIYKDKKHTDDIDTYIYKHVFAVYNKLKAISGNENIYTVIIQMIDIFIEMSNNVDFGDYEQRTNFEEQFDQAVSSMISSSVVESKKYINKYTITTTSTYLKIINNTATFNEINSYDSTLSSHYEFFTSKPHVKSKWFDICDICNTVESNSDKYKYIKILNSFSDQIQKLKYITSISSLSNKLINDNNYKMSRADAKTQSIATFISSSSTLRAMWNEFQIAWKEINSFSIQYKCKILPRLNEMTSDLAISFLLCDDKEPGYGMYIACAYQYLGSIQNEIIDEINEGEHNVTFPIQMMSSKQILSFDEDNVKLYEKFFYVYDVNNKSYKVDYDTINFDIKSKLISSKIKKINYEELNVIQYKYELLSMTNQHSNFIDVINRDIPQEKISDVNLLSQISTELSMKNSYDINSIYTMLELLCCQLKYEKKDVIYPSRAISDYIIASNRSENYDTLLKWNTITKVKLSNIICLYEIVEERIFDLIIDLISPDYKKDISDKEKANEVFKEMFEQNSDTMIYPTLLNVIKAVKKFIVRCLMSDIETHFAIRDYLTRKDLWNEIDGTTETMTDNMYNDFPESILICNTVKLYEMLNEMYKKTHVDLNSLKVENKDINYI